MEHRLDAFGNRQWQVLAIDDPRRALIWIRIPFCVPFSQHSKLMSGVTKEPLPDIDDLSFALTELQPNLTEIASEVFDRRLLTEVPQILQVMNYYGCVERMKPVKVAASSVGYLAVVVQDELPNRLTLHRGDVAITWAILRAASGAQSKREHSFARCSAT